VFVVGSPESLEAFGHSGHLPYCKTFIGAGPKRETVVFELNTKDDALLKRLVEEFNQRNATKLSI
jgi:hypothetical protein